MQIIRLGELEKQKFPHVIPEAAVEGMDVAILSPVEIEKQGLVHAVGRDPGLDLLLGRDSSQAVFGRWPRVRRTH